MLIIIHKIQTNKKVLVLRLGTGVAGVGVWFITSPYTMHKLPIFRRKVTEFDNNEGELKAMTHSPGIKLPEEPNSGVDGFRKKDIHYCSKNAPTVYFLKLVIIFFFNIKHATKSMIIFVAPFYKLLSVL